MASNPLPVQSVHAFPASSDMSAIVHALPSRLEPAEESWIAIIDSRPCRREFISNFLSQEWHGERVLPFSLDELMRERRSTSSMPSMIVFSVGGLSVSEPTVRSDFEQLLSSYRSVPIVILSDLDASGEAHAALASGASGFVSTLFEPGLMRAALALVRAGGKFAPPSFFDERVLTCGEGLRTEPSSEPVAGYAELTARQTHVLHLLQEGHANKVIAAKLGMTESTVKVHVRQIMRRLGASNRTEAALLAQRRQQALKRMAC